MGAERRAGKAVHAGSRATRIFSRPTTCRCSQSNNKSWSSRVVAGAYRASPSGAAGQTAPATECGNVEPSSSNISRRKHEGLSWRNFFCHGPLKNVPTCPNRRSPGARFRPGTGVDGCPAPVSMSLDRGCGYEDLRVRPARVDARFRRSPREPLINTGQSTTARRPPPGRGGFGNTSTRTLA